MVVSRGLGAKEVIGNRQSPPDGLEGSPPYNSDPLTFYAIA
jgi:hypothetical protein